MPPLNNETRDRIKSLLSDSPLMTARQIARQLEVDRAHVNRILHSSLDHFEKEGPAQWRSRTSDDALATTRRPQGPYGPARNLLPKGQTLHRVDGTATCIEILKKMLDCDFSAVPSARTAWSSASRRWSPFTSTFSHSRREPFDSRSRFRRRFNPHATSHSSSTLRHSLINPLIGRTFNM